MDHKKKLEELHKESMEKFDDYLKAKGEIGQEHHEKIHEAKKIGSQPGVS
jgi:predicted HicB family RNase H-like nuclease